MDAQKENVQKISKLIGITNEKVISQATEYFRILTIKTNFKTKNEYSRIVICLDICATKASERINIDKGLQLINYRKSKYLTEKNTILRILGVDITEASNIKSICIALGLTRIEEVEKNAARILEKLKKSKRNLLGEIDHPQNACMAVYQSCKLLGVAVNEIKLITLSRLQRKQWTQLKTLWLPWLGDEIRSSAKATKGISNNVVKAPKKGNRENPFHVIENVALESYDVWKKRILAKAYADLALLKKKSRQPRRSKRNAKK